MKYFTEKWYRSSNTDSDYGERYYDYIKNNYEFYPKWFKELNVPERKAFIFHDTYITDIKIEDSTINLYMVGIDNDWKDFCLTFENAKIIEGPEKVDDCYILAEELYCSKDGGEFHLLLEDDEADDNVDPISTFTISFGNIILKKEHYSLFFRIQLKIANIINYFSKYQRTKRKAKRNAKTDNYRE